MHGAINVKSPNNISKWQVGFNSAFKGLILTQLKKLTSFITSHTRSVLAKIFLGWAAEKCLATKH
jgi:hypothetical protein